MVFESLTRASGSGQRLSRKVLKSPDEFLSILRKLFSRLVDEGRIAIFLALGALVALAGIVSVIQYRKGEAKDAAEALYVADSSARKVLEKFAPQAGPDGAAPVAESAGPQGPVDETFSDAIAKYKVVSEKYGSTFPGFQARLRLGNLYYDHKEYAQAAQWFEQALDNAPARMEKVFVLKNLGHAYENQSKFSDAISAYDKALNLGDVGVKGELLLNQARSWMGAGDPEKARAALERVTSEMSGTPYAQTAEELKRQL